ncbi:Ras- C3 botulinum toxin substrate 3 [Balamuthia mandrillaris]
MSSSEVKKIVVVGDGAVGKTCLLMAYDGKELNEKYIPTIFDNYTTQVAYDGQNLRLSLWDTAGQEEYDRIRIMSYNNVDCFLICFSVADSVTLANVKERWVPELRHYAKSTPFILVGTKLDLRDGGSGKEVRRPVSYEEGKAMKEEIDAKAYMECSAITGAGVKAVFDTAIRVVMGEISNKPSRGRCSLF